MGLVPYGGYGGQQVIVPEQEDSLAGLHNSLLAQVSPQTLERLRGALWRGQALRALTSSACNLSGAAADVARMRASQSPNRPVNAGFEVFADNGAFGGHRVTISGRVWG